MDISVLFGVDKRCSGYCKDNLNIEFLQWDLEKPFVLNEEFDLCICLETLEHLSERASIDIIDWITEHCSKVLFSAAVPYQLGINHINLKPLMYWHDKFFNRGFSMFDIRGIFWDNREIPYWYRQNMVIFAEDSLDMELHDLEIDSCHMKIDVIHPELFKTIAEKNPLQFFLWWLKKKRLKL